MNIKRTKLALSITTLLLCLGVMCFGVYSATRVEYSIGGNITYEINAPLVSLSTKLYASKENAFDAKGNVAEVMYNMDLYLNYGEGTMPSSIEEVTTYHSPTQGTYVNGQLTNENTFETTSLPLNFGEYEQNTKAYVYYAVTEISNYAHEPVSMQLDLGDLAFTVEGKIPYNTLAIPLKTLDNISAGSADAPTKSYVIVAFTINDLATSVDTVDFGMSITINQGELTPTDLSMEGIQVDYDSELGGYVIQRVDSELGLEKLILPTQYNDGVNGLHDMVGINDDNDAGYYTITDIYLPNSIKYIGSLAVNGSFRCLYIPDSVTMITEWSFQELSSVLSIRLPNNDCVVDGDPENLVGHCPFLISIYIPKGVYNLGTISESNDRLLKINISEENPYYCAIDGVAYSKDMSKLIGYPTAYPQTEFEVPNTVTTIEDYVFSECQNLISIIIPNSVFEIGSYTFSGCISLDDIEIRNSEVSIGESAFNGCKFTNVKYETSNTGYTFKDGTLTITADMDTSLSPTWYNDNLNNLILNVVFSDSVIFTGIGTTAFHDCLSLTSIAIPNSVTSIGDGAFSNCSNLTSITIPNSVTSIGTQAFNSCKFTNVKYETSGRGYTFKDGVFTITSNMSAGNVLPSWDGANINPLITNVVFSDSVTFTVIGIDAFRGCSSLTSITIPSSVTSIGEDAFSSCRALETVTFGANSQLESIGYSAFYNCSSLTGIEIPSSVTSIGSSAFSYCRALETVTFGANSQLESIGYSAFSICFTLTSIEIPSSVTSIGSSAFSSTPWLTNLQNTSYGIATASDGQTRFAIDVPTDITDDELDMTNVKVIAGGAFWNCSNLTSIEIPSSVKSIGDSAFRYCNKLENITVDPSNANYCSDEYGVLFNKDKTELIQYPIGNTRTQYTIPSSVTSIESYAFAYCSALETVTFEDTDSIWMVNNTEIIISEHTPQELADYLTNNYSYYGYTWTKNV